MSTPPPEPVAIEVTRLEYRAADGRWTGPHCVQPASARLLELRKILDLPHDSRPEPDPEIFAANPGVDRYVCACPSLDAFRSWFGDHIDDLLAEGGRLAVYRVPIGAIAHQDHRQVVYQQRQATLVRVIHPVPGMQPPGNAQTIRERTQAVPAPRND